MVTPLIITSIRLPLAIQWFVEGWGARGGCYVSRFEIRFVSHR